MNGEDRIVKIVRKMRIDTLFKACVHSLKDEEMSSELSVDEIRSRISDSGPKLVPHLKELVKLTGGRYHKRNQPNKSYVDVGNTELLRVALNQSQGHSTAIIRHSTSQSQLAASLPTFDKEKLEEIRRSVRDGGQEKINSVFGRQSGLKIVVSIHKHEKVL